MIQVKYELGHIWLAIFIKEFKNDPFRLVVRPSLTDNWGTTDRNQIPKFNEIKIIFN